MEKGAYILGTHQAELFRLGLQHQVWASEARRAWDKAGFKLGQTILDMGCGPGFCSTELAYRVGNAGKVIAADVSTNYTQFLGQISKMQGLNIDLMNVDLHNIELQPNSLDGIFCRWVLAWIDGGEQIVERLIPSMKKGAHFITQEYYAWDYFKTEPYDADVMKGIKAAFKSFEDAPGDVNIGKQMPSLFEKYGLEVVSVRPISVLCRPNDFAWSWPESFLEVYWPKLVDLGYISKQEAQDSIDAFKGLKNVSGASCFCPPVVEVIGRKI